MATHSLRLTSALLALGGLISTSQAEVRSIDGSGNNLLNPTWGAAGTQLVRMGPAAYGDGVSTPSGAGRANPRTISNTIVAQSGSVPSARNLTTWIFQWGQFIDHDMDLTGGASPAEAFHIPIPLGDPIFDPTSGGSAIMPFTRSLYDTSTGTGPGDPRQQVNEITSFLDASMVYGSDATRAAALRSFSGGRLLTSAGNLLPFNTAGLPNGSGGHPDPTQFFLAGDIRANEQVGLTAIHTLFMREHNRLADQIAAANPGWSDEQIYQRARKLVGAEVQAITFKEFLPALLGSNAPSAMSAYDPNVNPSVLNEFSTAFFRVGHTMLTTHLFRTASNGAPAPGGHIALRDAFFQTANIADGTELAYLLKGLATQQQQEIDNLVVDDVRNFLFGEPMPFGFDLAALNIQRGRDHGLPDYNTLRVAFGLSPVSSFTQISSDVAVQAALALLYPTVGDIDPWIGALAEDHLADSSMGELLTAALVEQFTRVRDGDRFWFTNDDELSAAEIAELMNTTLCNVILANTDIPDMRGNVFLVPEPSTAMAVGLAGLAIVRRRRR